MVAPPPPPPPRFMPPTQYPSLPSRHFCQTGSLAEGERYHPDLHNMGTTPRERCAHFYPEYAGGKRRKRHTNRKRKTRKNKKSRKHRRKSHRRH